MFRLVAYKETTWFWRANFQSYVFVNKSTVFRGKLSILKCLPAGSSKKQPNQKYIPKSSLSCTYHLLFLRLLLRTSKYLMVWYKTEVICYMVSSGKLRLIFQYKNNLLIITHSLYDCKFNIKVHHLFSIAKFSQVYRSRTTYYLKKTVLDKLCNTWTLTSEG
jgi:hypothetical protein